MLALVDWLIILAYIILTVVIGLAYSKKSSKSLTDYFLSGRQMPWVVAGLSMVATTFAADTPLAVTELVGKGGVSGNWLWWNFLIGGMLTTLFFAHLWRRAGVLTEVELLEIRYSGKIARFLRGFKALYLGLLMNGLIIAWVNLALMSIIEVFFDVHGQMLMLIMLTAMLIAVVYSTLSGLWGVAVTDVVQFIIAMTGSIVLAVLVINSHKIGGIEGLKAKVPQGALSFFPRIGQDNAGEMLTISFGAFLAYGLFQWWASWYPGAEPGGGGYIAQRMMSTKGERQSVFATLLFQITHYALRPWPWILVGLAALVLYPDLDSAHFRFAYVYTMRDFLPTGLKGLLLVAFLAAYMSTISTQLNFGASVLTNDFYLLLVKKPLSPRRQVGVARVVTVILMLVSLYLTTIINSISGVWSFIIECGAGLGLVLILRWYWWRVSAWSELAAMVTPFIVYALARFAFDIQFPESYFLTVGVTTLVWVVVTFIAPGTDPQVLKDFYSRVRPGGLWGPVKKELGFNDKGPGWQLFVAWIAAVVMGYSTLFWIGALLLHQWHDLLVYSVSFFLGLALFIRFFRVGYKV